MRQPPEASQVPQQLLQELAALWETPLPVLPDYEVEIALESRQDREKEMKQDLTASLRNLEERQQRPARSRALKNDVYGQFVVYVEYRAKVAMRLPLQLLHEAAGGRDRSRFLEDADQELSWEVHKTKFRGDFRRGELEQLIEDALAPVTARRPSALHGRIDVQLELDTLRTEERKGREALQRAWARHMESAPASASPAELAELAEALRTFLLRNASWAVAEVFALAPDIYHHCYESLLWRGMAVAFLRATQAADASHGKMDARAVRAVVPRALTLAAASAAVDG